MLLSTIIISTPFFLFVIYLIGKDIEQNSRWFKKIKQYIQDKRLQRYENTRLSDYHPYYWMWKEGDELVVDKGSYNGLAMLQTYSANHVIATDMDNNNEIILYGEQIIENNTYEKRQKLKEANKFQQDVLPEIRQENINDMNLLQTKYNDEKEKVNNSYNGSEIGIRN